MVYDNAAIIAQDPRIRSATMANLAAIFHGGYWYQSPGSGLYRPLTTLSYLVNFAILGGGLNPSGYHWVNLLIHLANAALVYALGMLLIGRAGPAFALALLWGVHPILTEGVTNIVGRADLLAGLGVLGGLVCYIKCARTPGASYPWLVTAILALATGMFAKENALILLPLVLWFDLTVASPESWQRRLPRYAALAMPVAVYWFLRSQTPSRLAVDFADNPLAGAGFWQAKLTALGVLLKLAGLVLWPQHLSADYSFNAIPLFGTTSGWWGNLLPFVALAGCAAALVLAVRCRRSHAVFAFLIGFFLLALAPTSNLFVTIGAIMGERFAYLAAVPLIASLVLTADRLRGRVPVYPLAAVAGMACVALALRTYARNRDWQDSYSLWSSAVAVYPDDARAHYLLANSLLYVSDNFDPEGASPPAAAAAIREYRTALRILPNYVEARVNLARTLLQQPGGLAEALPELQEAARLRPEYPEIRNELGVVLSRFPGRMPDAIREFQTAIEERPGYVEAHGNLGNAWLQTPGRLEDAIREDRIVTAARPQFDQAHYNLASVLLMAGRPDEAIAEYKEALRINPDLAEAHYNLGIILSRIHGREAESEAEFAAAIRLRPDLGQRRR